MAISKEKQKKILEYHNNPDYSVTEAVEELNEKYGITRGQYQYYAYDKKRRQENKEDYRKRQNEYRRKRYQEDEEFREKQKKRSREVQKKDEE